MQTCQAKCSCHVMQISQAKFPCHVMQICQASKMFMSRHTDLSSKMFMPHHANLSIRWNHDCPLTTYCARCKFYANTSMTLWLMQSCARWKTCPRQCYLFWTPVLCQCIDAFTSDSKPIEWRIIWQICRMLDNFLNLCLHFYIMHYMHSLNVLLACLCLCHVIIYLILHVYA